MDEQARVLIHKDSGRKFVWDGKGNFHTQYGYLETKNLVSAKAGTTLSSNTHHEFYVFDPTFIDLYSKIKRSPAIIPRKDVGAIITYTGIGKDSVVLEAGSGSGGLCLYLAHIAKKVYSYDIREDHLAIVKNNVAFMGFKNVSLHLHNIYEGALHKDVDVVVLDLAEPWLAVESAFGALAVGGFVVSYSPCVPQVGDFVSAAQKRFSILGTIELIEREWEVDGRKIRPKSLHMGHSGFLSFARKMEGD